MASGDFHQTVFLRFGDSHAAAYSAARRYLRRKKTTDMQISPLTGSADHICH
jgi:hypothetical protein